MTTSNLLTAARKVLELSEKATKGPWHAAEVHMGIGDDSYLYSASGPEIRDNRDQAGNDAKLVAHLRNHSPAIARALIKLHEIAKRGCRCIPAGNDDDAIFVPAYKCKICVEIEALANTPATPDSSKTPTSEVAG